MAPDTVSLRYFLVLAQELNFTRAAARIGIAQPALSARMCRLEAELGTALLVRNTRSVVLTTAGAALAESAPPALAALDPWHTARSAAAGELGSAHRIQPQRRGQTAPALVDRLICSSRDSRSARSRWRHRRSPRGRRRPHRCRDHPR